MWIFLALMLVLAAGSFYLWKYQTEYFSKVILGVGFVASFAADLAAEFGAFDWSTILPAPYSGWMTTAVLLVGFLARFTKSKLPAA